MILENYGSVWQIENCSPRASFNLLDDNDMMKSFNWVYLKPMCSTENNSKIAKADYHLHLLQEVKAKYFLKLNDPEGLNEDLQ